MTIHTDAKTSTPNVVSPEQIRQENAAAEQASQGYVAPEQVGASDNVSDASHVDDATRRQNAADIVREQQNQVANDRENLMADIAARRRQHINEENGEGDDYYATVDNDDEVQQNQSQEVETSGAQEAQAAQEAQQPAESGPRFYTDEAGQEVVELLVNGKKTVVPAQRVYAAAQKLEAGDEKLRLAAQERAQLQAERQQFEQERLAAKQIQQPSSDATPELKAQLREGLIKLQDGDEHAVDALVDTLAQGRQPTTPQIDTAQLAAQVTQQQNRTAWGNNLHSDAQAYESDPAYADITSNPMLAEKAAAYAKQYCNDHQSWNTGERPRDIMNRAAERVRAEAKAMAEAFGYLSPQATNQQQVTTQQTGRSAAVEARKSQAGSTVVSSQTQRESNAQRQVAQDGGRSPSSMDAKLAAFSGIAAARNNPAIKR